MVAQRVPVSIEDGSELTRVSWALLEAEGKDLGFPDLRIQPISDFLKAAEHSRTSLADRQAILSQATLIFDHLYPHMPFKTDIYHFKHPSDYLRQDVQPNLDALAEIDFHTQMLTAFSLVRDAHTLYGLPSPFRGAAAFLPFQMRAYLNRKTGWRFIVTSVMNSHPGGGFGHPLFGPGAELTGWGDVSTLAHVEHTETHLPGGNFFASFMRGAIHSTLRPLAFVQPPPPDEIPAATLYYRPLGREETHAIRIPWAVGTGFGPAAGFPNSVFSVSPATAITTACGRILHHRVEMRQDSEAAQSQDQNQISTIPQTFDFQYTQGSRKNGYVDIADLSDKERPEARFGYIRIIAFSDGSSGPGSTDRIVEEFQRIVALMDRVAPDGLVIDIRSNPGGDVPAAERMLQMLTAEPIEPARFHLANTPVVLDILRSLKASMNERLSSSDDMKLAQALAELEAWIDDTEQSPFPEGSPLTGGRPLTDPDSANRIGQIYHGRGVVLLINSLTYSAADIFAAGFQDHAVGLLLGTSMSTGGGGANVWSHQDLLDKIGPQPGIPLAKLPGDASMSLAIRRCSRVKRFEGQPVEDRGVSVDIFHPTDSKEDLIAGNTELLRRACQELRDRKVFRVDAGQPVLLDNGGVTVDVRTIGVVSLKFFLNGHLALTAAAGGNAPQTFHVPAVRDVAAPAVLRIEGYAPGAAGDGALQLVRARTIPLQKPVVLDDFDPATQSITGTDS